MVYLHTGIYSPIFKASDMQIELKQLTYDGQYNQSKSVTPQVRIGDIPPKRRKAYAGNCCVMLL